MIIDIIAAVIVFISTLIAFLRGLIREVLTIAGVIGGALAAYYGGPVLDPYMQGWIGVDPESEEPEPLFGPLTYDMLAQGLSYGLIFIVVVIVLSILSHFLAEAVKSIGLGAVDRTLGVIFGIVRGALLLGLMYLPVHLTQTTDEERKAVKEQWFAGSQSHFYMEVTADWIAKFLPEGTKEDIQKKVEDGAEKARDASSIGGALERMELLEEKGARDAADDERPDASGNTEGEQPAESDAQKDNSGGYNENFRDEMDQLFQYENNDKNGQ